MSTRLASFAAGAAFAALLVSEIALDPFAAETAARFPEAAHLETPVLALALVFCAAGQLALIFLVFVPRRPGRVVAAGLLIVLAGAIVAIEVLTMATHVTPPLLALAGWPAAVALAVGSVVLVLRSRRTDAQARMPAARAGSA